VKLTALALPILFAFTAPLHAHEPTLILMGGSYRTCSSLGSDNCEIDKRQFPGARQAPSYRIDSKFFPAILDPGYWAGRDRPPAINAIGQMLTHAEAMAGDRTFDGNGLMSLFESKDPDIWNALLVSEQDMIVSAFEIPQVHEGVRRKEGVRLDGGKGGHDESLFRRFVQEAAARAPGKKPRIAFVTSAAANNFDSVDFYRKILQQAGAEVVWWPVDASMNAAIFGQQGCDALPRLRQQIFSQLRRETVFPDLAEQQQKACLQAGALADLPMQVQGVFFDGGDQWLHWNTFFNTDGKANTWLENLRTAFANGNLVVAGTSAGTAIQSGPVMITNGTSANALVRGARIYGSMPEGCDRAKRCPEDLQEDDLTFWPGGGFALAGPILMDTHFSDRSRELRFITLLNAAKAEAGIGVDETSAVMLRFGKSEVAVEAFGRSGAWWMMKPVQGQKNGSLSLLAHYLAPGKTLHWRDGQLHSENTALFDAGKKADSTATDALARGAMRESLWKMVSNHQSKTTLRAQGHLIEIAASPTSRFWQGPENQMGITDLKLVVTDEEISTGSGQDQTSH
jgi:cyanophycinase-like exopeptidase